MNENYISYEDFQKNSEIDELYSANRCNNDYTRDEMLKQIKELKFSIIELGLYLDTHPDDEKAICLHKEYCNKYRKLADQYQKIYGPLTIMFPCNKWRWLEEPWPWEGGIN
jgi:spore coat protein JB